MLIYLKCFGTDIDEVVLVVANSASSFGELKDTLRRLRPRFTVKRWLFAGRELIDASKSLGLFLSAILNMIEQFAAR